MNSKKQENLAIFIALNLADFCTTACIIAEGGIEVMPVAANFIEWRGISGLFFHKLFVASALGWLCRGFSQRLWDLLNGAFSVIVAWNSIQLFSYVVLGGVVG